jgi:hypothetical protein
MACNDSESSDDAAIREAIERIAYEAHHLREDMAALKALGQARERVNCPFMLVASSALRSDLLARLARVLERDGRVGSFWFLHRRGVIQADRPTIKFLSDIAGRMELIRNKVFAHIDKEVLMTLKSHIETPIYIGSRRSNRRSLKSVSSLRRCMKRALGGRFPAPTSQSRASRKSSIET